MPKRILIADGSPSERAALANLARHAGFAPSEAADLPLLSEAVRAGRYDAVIVNSDLPGMESPGILSEIQRILPSATVLQYTRLSDTEIRIERLDEGVHPPELHTTKERLLDYVKAAMDSDPLDSLINLSNEAIVVTDGDGRITRCSNGASILLGYHRDEIIGLPIDVIRPGLSEPEPESTETGVRLARRKHRDGHILNVELTRTSIAGPEDREIGCMEILRDVTGSIEREREIELLKRFYERVIDTISDGIRVIDAAGGRIVLANMAHVEWTGVSGGEMIGLTSRDVPWGTDSDGNPVSVQELIEKAIDSREPVRAVLNAGPQDASHAGYTDVGAFPMINVDGDVDYVVLVGRDVSEQVHMKALLAAERDRRDQIIRSAPAGIITTDERGVIEFANAHAAEIFGFTDPSELKLRNLFALPEFGHMNIEDGIRATMKTGAPFSIDHAQCTSANGAELTVNVRAQPLYHGNGEIAGVVAVLENVTERLTLLRRLRATTSDLAMLAEIGELIHHSRDTDTILQAILVGVTAGEGLGFNRAFLLETEWETRQLRGKFAIGPADRAEAERIWTELNQKHLNLAQVLYGYQRAIEQKQVRINEIAVDLRLPLEEAENIAARAAIEQQAFLVRGDTDPMLSRNLADKLGTDRFAVVPLIFNDRVEGVIIADNAISGEEITRDDLRSLELFAHQATLAVERAQLYTELEQSLRDLQIAHTQLKESHELTVRNERLAAMGQVAAQVAHEIRNPLVSIGGFARAIRKRLEEDNPLNQYASIIVEETTRLEAILNEVLQFSRPKAQYRTKADLVELVNATLRTMDTEIAERTIKTEVSLPDSPVFAHVDTGQMKQVLRNLIANAIDAIAEHRSSKHRRIGVALNTQPEHLILAVEDTGHGLDEEARKNLFEPFFTTKSTGTGLGLSICRQIVADHGGDILAENNGLGGATFYVMLPRGEEDKNATNPGGGR